MPRKAKNVHGANPQPTTPCDENPQPTLTEEQAAADNTPPNDRDAGGKFTKGNAGGPGNPHARACAKMLEIFRNSFSEDEMLQIFRMLYVKAVSGDIGAAKIILSYKIGKPLPAPHPDSIDRDEWDHYQSDAIREQEMKHVMTSLPTQAGNDIVRVSLPIMTASRMNDFASQLVDSLPTKKKDEGGRRKKDEKKTAPKKNEGARNTNEEKTASSEPIANGNLGGENAERGEGRNQKTARTSSTEAPLANGKSGHGYAEKGARTTTRETPLPNGKFGRVTRPKNGRRIEKRASVEA